MALTNEDKQQIIDELDVLDEGLRRVIIASLEAFSSWLMNTVYSIYQKIKPEISRLWQWIVSQFS